MSYRAYWICDYCGKEEDAEDDTQPPEAWHWDEVTGADFCPACVEIVGLEQLLTEAMRAAGIRPITDIADPHHLFTPPAEETPCPSPASAR